MNHTTPKAPASSTVLTTAAAILVFAGSASRALAAHPGVEIVAMTGTPTANGVMAEMSYRSVINSAGVVASSTTLTGTANGGRDSRLLFRAVPGAVTEITRSGGLTPNANGILLSVLGYGMNDAGLVAGTWFLDATANAPADDFAVFAGSGGPSTQIARAGDAAPGGVGVFGYPSVAVPMPDNSIIFYADIKNGVPAFQTGLFRNVSGVNTTIVRTGQNAPGGVGTFNQIFSEFDVNSAGQCAFTATLNGTPDQFTDSGVFRSNGVTTTAIAREGQIMPDGNGQLYSSLGGLSLTSAIANDGTVAFTTDTLGTALYPADRYAVMLAGAGPLKIAARTNQQVPGGNGAFASFSRLSTLSAGRVLFAASLQGTSGGPGVDDGGLYLSDGTTITTLIRKGDPIPNGNGAFAIDHFARFDVNDNDDIALWTEVRGQLPGTLSGAVFFKRNGQAPIEIIREGDAFLGGTVAHVSIAAGEGAPESRAINNAGQVVFRVELTDGRTAVARFTPPPTCLGDFNNDGQRNTLDLTMFLGKFGQIVGAYGIGDMNGDGAVNTQDLTAFLGVFGILCR
jgi:hypothetical protein